MFATRRLRMPGAAVRMVACAAVCTALSGLTATGTEGRLPGDSINEIRLGYVTPHIEWARPWAGGRLRVFFILPHTSAAREAVELAQRLDIEVFGEAVIDSAHLGSESRYIAPIEGTRPEEKVARLRRKLQSGYDAFVIGNVHWDVFPAEIQYRILKQVAEGAGLVIVYAARLRSEMLKHKLAGPAAEIARGVPWAGLRFFRERLAADARLTPQNVAEKTITAARFGKGRIVVLDYRTRSATVYGGFGLTPHEEYTFESAASYEGYHMLVARALLWSAGRGPEVRFENWPDEPMTTPVEALPGQAVDIELAATDAVPAHLSVHLTVRNMWNETEWASRRDAVVGADRKTSAEFALPALPAGDYFADVVVRSLRGIENFGAFTLRVTAGNPHITQLTPAKDGWEQDEAVSAVVRLSDSAPEGARLRCSLRDNYGRVFERWFVPIAPGAREATVSRSPARAVSLCGRLRVGVEIRGRLLDRKETVFYVRRHPLDRYPLQLREYPVLIWGTLPGILGHFAYTQLRNAGFTAVLTHVGDKGAVGRRLARDDLMIVPYCARVGTRFPIGGKGPVCFADSAFREAQKKAVQAKAAPLRTVAPLVYSLGDENFIPSDAGTHPADKPAFAAFLRRRYGSIERLNQVWGTRFAKFAEAVEFQPRKGTPAQFARDYEFDGFRKWQYAEFHHFLAGSIRETNPDARVGAEGSQPGDLEETVRGLQFWGPYRRLRYNTLLRSVAPRELVRGNWFGGYLSQRRDPLALPDFVWQALFDGNNLIEYFCISTAERIFDTGFNFGEWNQRFRPAFQEIVDGLGQLAAASEADLDGVALLHSEGSTYTQRWMPASDYNKSHEAWLQVFSDLGVQASYVTTRQMLAGRLRRGDIRVLVMPAISALSDGEAAEVRRFVEGGGVVIADDPPGLFDGFGRPRPHGVLDDVFGVRTAWKELKAASAAVDAAPDADAMFAGLHLPRTTVFVGPKAESARVCGRAGDAPVLFRHAAGDGLAVLLGARITAYTGWRKQGTETPLRLLILRLLEAGGVEQYASVEDPSGRPVRAVRQVRYRRGDCRWIGLLRVAGFDDNRPIDAFVRLRSRAWIVDLRTGRRFGWTRRVPVRLAPGRGVVLGVLPRSVTGLHVVAPGRVIAGADVPIRARLNGPWWRFGRTPRLSGLVWRLHVTGPDGVLRRFYCDTRYTDGPSAEFRVPFAWNDPPGRWRIEVRCVSAGVRRTLPIELFAPADNR